MDQFAERRASAQEIRDAIAKRTIETADRATLAKYSAWLCTPDAHSAMSVGAEHEQVSELVRFHMLRSMIDAFEYRSKVMQRWLLFFAAFAIFATLMPYIIQPSPKFGANPLPTELIEKTGQGSSQAQPSIASPSSQAQPPASGQAVKQGTGKATKESP